MKPTLTVGTQAEVTAEVTEDMCPAFDGVVVHRVYSTWSMAHHMELAARMVLAPHLEPDEEGIGAHLSIDHVAPTPVGHTIRVVAVATEVADTTVVCACTAYDGDRVVGRGQQVQRVLPKKKLSALIARASKSTNKTAAVARAGGADAPQLSVPSQPPQHEEQRDP